MTIQTALVQGTSLLEESHVPSPRLTAEVLLSYALRCERIFLYSHSDDELTEVAWLHYGRYLHQRMQGKPTQYITKRQEFYGRDFRVTPAVLIPRPETELVVEHAIKVIPPRGRVVDVGCGSGAIATTLALETSAEVYATDISTDALLVARENACRLGARVRFATMDLLGSFRSLSLDAVVSNPPYVAHAEADGLQREVRDHEPHVALFAGPNGTELYERIVEDAQRVLKPGGVLVLELGWKSLQAVQAMLQAPWTDHAITDDLAGIPRAISARWAP
jgi:release factor glutamine methyltransferase